MINVIRWAALAASVAILAACAKPAADTAADEAAIRDTNTAFAKAYAAGDVAGVAGLYADDAVFMPPGMPAVHGGAAIREYWSKDIPASAAAGVTIAFVADTDVGVVGDLGWESGSLTVTDKSGAVVEHAKYLTVFRKTDSRWLMVRDIFNSDAPPAPPAAPAPAPAPTSTGKPAG
jgi:uncharacterized protein (TIGR02246 family)